MRIVAIAVVLTVSMPASAQFTDRGPAVYGPPAGPSLGGIRPPSTPVPRIRVQPPGEAHMRVGRDLADIERQIDRGRDAGTLTHRQAREYRRDAGQIGTLTDRYRQDGLSSAEQQELNLRAGVLRDQVNLQRLRGAQPK